MIPLLPKKIYKKIVWLIVYRCCDVTRDAVNDVTLRAMSDVALDAVSDKTRDVVSELTRNVSMT